MQLLFAILPVDPTYIAQMVVNGLAVGGGFLVGYFLSGLIFYFLDKWLMLGKSPQSLHWFAKRLGGLLLAIVVALIVFGSGAGGFGLGRGPGNGESPGTSKGDGTAPTSLTSPVTAKILEQPINTEPAPLEQRLRVLLLSGEEVQEERFYLIEDDTKPKSFAELVNAVKAKQESTGKPVGIEIRFTTVNPLSQGHGAVTRLVNWAKTNQHTVSFPAKKS
jgi:hypothetical protein